MINLALLLIACTVVAGQDVPSPQVAGAVPSPVIFPAPVFPPSPPVDCSTLTVCECHLQCDGWGWSIGAGMCTDGRVTDADEWADGGCDGICPSLSVCDCADTCPGWGWSSTTEECTTTSVTSRDELTDGGCVDEEVAAEEEEEEEEDNGGSGASDLVCVVERDEYLGDGYCDTTDNYNTALCDWDHGDCCADTCVNGTWTCGPDYECLDPNVVPAPNSVPAPGTVAVPAPVPVPSPSVPVPIPAPGVPAPGYVPVPVPAPVVAEDSPAGSPDDAELYLEIWVPIVAFFFLVFLCCCIYRCRKRKNETKPVGAYVPAVEATEMDFDEQHVR